MIVSHFSSSVCVAPTRPARSVNNAISQIFAVIDRHGGHKSSIKEETMVVSSLEARVKQLCRCSNYPHEFGKITTDPAKAETGDVHGHIQVPMSPFVVGNHHDDQEKRNECGQESPNSVRQTTSAPHVVSSPHKQPYETARTVSFVGFVRVRWIPNRNDYSSEVKAALWTSRQEILENASRNTVEYASEGWDVSRVVEEEFMIDYCGQKMHPVHFCEDMERSAYLSSIMEKRRRNKKQRIAEIERSRSNDATMH